MLGITRILAFGDSMTAGTTSAPMASFYALSAGLPASYPFKLQQLLSARYSGQTIETQNAGTPGEMTEQGRERFSGVLSDTSPELVLLMEGANDLNNMSRLRDGPINEAIQKVVDAIEDMVRAAQGRGVTVMVATLPPQRKDSPKGGGADFLDRYNNGLRTMASKKGAILVDVHAEFPLSLIGQDGLHPTDDGYRKLAEIFQAAIATRYEKAPAVLR